MTKVLYVPLDERACNYRYPQALAQMARGVELLVPPKEWMGFCKRPADVERLWAWVFSRAAECEYAILSVDTLVYGNIVGSRIHQRSEAECQALLDRFAGLKRAHPTLRIHAFHLVARVAAYNNAAEDPDYWALHGANIWRFGYLTDRQRRGLGGSEEEAELERLRSAIPPPAFKDFLRRRKTDLATNLRCVELTAQGVFDVLTIPKDDTAEYGYAAMDQQAVAELVRKKRLMGRVLVYPGADEVGCVLFARVFNLITGYVPRVYPRFSSVLGPQIVPLYEDRPLYESVKSQIVSVGGVCVESAMESDCLLAINSPGKAMIEAAAQDEKDISFSSHINMHELLRYIHYYHTHYQKPIGLAEVSVCNGCENEFMTYSLQSGMLNEVSAVGGWNTAQNTIGVVLAQTVIAAHENGFAGRPAQLDAMKRQNAHALIADWLFQSNVLPQFLKETEGKIDAFALGDHAGEALDCIVSRLKPLIRETLGHVHIENPGFDWDMARMFTFDVRLDETTKGDSPQ